MKKLLYFATAFAVVLTSCYKEKPVTLDHPVSVDMEGDARQREYPVQFFDLDGAACDGDAFLSYLDPEADLFLAMAPYDWSAWFSSVLPEQEYFNYVVISDEEDDLCYAIATSAHIDLKTIVMDTQNVPYAILGNRRLVLSALSSTDRENELLEATYVIQPEYGWLYAARLGKESDTFRKAAFTDCYKAQWGEKFLWEGRTDYLYAGPGIWNNVKQIRIDRFADIPNPVYSFKVISEEDAR